MQELSYPEDGKPTLPLPVDFSISHSGVLIACALVTKGRVGLDVEMLRPMDVQVFRRMFTDAERAHAGSDPRKFFDLWSSKEAVIKAWGQGGVWDMSKVSLRKSGATLAGTHWQLLALDIDPAYSAHVAMDRKSPAATLHSVELDISS
nr:hypothetical protein Hi04_10k_c5801_00039 [uncultured bacterium]